MEAPALLARKPQAIGDHPSPQSLAAYPESMFLKQDFGCHGRFEVGIVRSNQLDCIPSNTRVQSAIRCAASRLMYQRAAASGFILRQ
jgi:hypothetical protein